MKASKRFCGQVSFGEIGLEHVPNVRNFFNLIAQKMPLEAQTPRHLLVEQSLGRDLHFFLKTPENSSFAAFEVDSLGRKGDVIGAVFARAVSKTIMDAQGWKDPTNALHLEWLGVREDAYGQKISDKLLGMVKSKLSNSASDFGRIEAKVSLNNPHAYAVLQRNEFVDMGFMSAQFWGRPLSFSPEYKRFVFDI